MKTYKCINLDDISMVKLERVALSDSVHPLQRAYTILRLIAAMARLHGDIPQARRCERNMDDIYNKLPLALRW